jgi:GTPase SAR1 family protein
MPTRNVQRFDYSDVPEHIDIILFGPAGAGKTSLIKTFYRALHDTRVIPPLMASNLVVKSKAANEGTRRFTKVTIKPEEHLLPVVQQGNGGRCKKNEVYLQAEHQIRIHDTRGQIWMDQNEIAQLNLIIDGKIRDMSLVEQRNYRYAYLLWEFWKRDTELFPDNIFRDSSQVSLKTKPHCIVFVFDGSMDEIPNGQEETAFYKDIITRARERRYFYPQVVLTCVDKVEAQMLEDEEQRLGRPLDDFERE